MLNPQQGLHLHLAALASATAHPRLETPRLDPRWLGGGTGSTWRTLNRRSRRLGLRPLRPAPCWLRQQ
eukprot:9250335-Lingulodinium_polyedra.AAC.1